MTAQLSLMMFGVLPELLWPSKTTKLSYAQVVRFDHLPDRLRRRLNDDYVDRASASLALSPKAAKKHMSRDQALVPLLKNESRPGFEVHVDPVVSQHFLMANAKVAADGSEKNGVPLERRMADALAAIRMALGTPIGLVCPAIWNATVGAILYSLGREAELERWPRASFKIASKCDVKVARRLAKAIGENRRQLEVVVRRFNLGVCRSSKEDALLDLVIGLDSLYLPDGRGEMTYRLKQRCAYHLFDSYKERKDAFDKIGDLYEMRSSLAHGSSYTLEEAAKNSKCFKNSPIDSVGSCELLLSNGLRRVLLELPAGSSAGERAAYFDDYVLGKNKASRSN